MHPPIELNIYLFVTIGIYHYRNSIDLLCLAHNSKVEYPIKIYRTFFVLNKKMLVPFEEPAFCFFIYISHHMSENHFLLLKYPYYLYLQDIC